MNIVYCVKCSVSDAFMYDVCLCEMLLTKKNGDDVLSVSTWNWIKYIVGTKNITWIHLAANLDMGCVF